MANAVLSEETKAHLHSQLIKLGDMMGDGLHHEPDGRWISKEYTKVLRALGIAPKQKRANNSEVINPNNLSHDKINFGSKVRVFDFESKEEKDFIIVGTFETNPKENKISNISPLGKTLLGKTVGDEVEFRINDTTFSFEIISIEKY